MQTEGVRREGTGKEERWKQRENSRLKVEHAILTAEPGQHWCASSHSALASPRPSVLLSPRAHHSSLESLLTPFQSVSRCPRWTEETLAQRSKCVR
eukprot:2050507-Pleurochrysis_carterae.AAC.4